MIVYGDHTFAKNKNLASSTGHNRYRNYWFFCIFAKIPCILPKDILAFYDHPQKHEKTWNLTFFRVFEKGVEKTWNFVSFGSRTRFFRVFFHFWFFVKNVIFDPLVYLRKFRCRINLFKTSKDIPDQNFVSQKSAFFR